MALDPRRQYSRKIHVVSTPAMPERWQEHGIPHGAWVHCEKMHPGSLMLVVDFTTGGKVICAWQNRQGDVVEYMFPSGVLTVRVRPR